MIIVIKKYYRFGKRCKKSGMHSRLKASNFQIKNTKILFYDFKYRPKINCQKKTLYKSIRILLKMNVKKNQINIKMQKKNKRDRRMVKNCFV